MFFKMLFATCVTYDTPHALAEAEVVLSEVSKLNDLVMNIK